MAGRVQWEAQVDSNVAKLLSETKELRDQLDGIKKGNYEIKLNIDDKKLEKVISNLDKMLESLGKGTGDFKEFENLSKQLNKIVSEVKELNKAFGGINDSGVNNLLSSIQSIDKSLSSLSEHITNVNKDFGSVGKNASDNVGQINEARKATEGLTEATKELANTQKNVGNKSNISSGNEVAEAEQYKKISNDTVSVLTDIGKTEDQIVEKIQRERIEAEKNNEVLREHLVLLDKAGKVVANHWGSTNNVSGAFSEEQLQSAVGGKIIHAHPGKSSFFGGKDLTHLLNDAMYEQIKQVELIWGDSSLLVDKSTLTKQSKSTLLNIMRNVRTKLTEMYGDNPDGAPSREAREHINAIEKEIFKSVAQKLNVSVSETGEQSKAVVDALSDVDKAIIRKFKGIEASVIQDINPSEIISSISIKDTFQGDLKASSESSTPAIKNEAKAMEQVAENAEKASKGKDNFAKANKKVKESADSSADSIEKETSALDEKEWDKNVKAIQEYMDANTKLNNLKAQDKGTGKKSSEIAYQTKEVERLEKVALEARAALSSMINPHEAPIDDWNKWLEVMKQFDQATEGSARSVAKLEDALRNMAKSQSDKIGSIIDSNQTHLDKLRPSDGNRSVDFEKAVQEYNKAIFALREFHATLDSSTPLTREQSAKYEKLSKSLKEARVEMEKFSAAEKGSTESSRWKEIDKITKYLEKNTKISKTAKQQLEAFIDTLKNVSGVNVEDIHMQFNKIAESERRAGREGKNFFDILTDKAVYGAAAQLAGYYLSLTDFIRYVGEGIQTIRELDTALTEMRKVSDETVSSLERFQSISFDLADDVGTTAKQIQNSTADWMRLGEVMSEASESAQVSNILLNVSEFEGIDEATESLVSMSQAYKDLEKIEIVDTLNKLGNEYAISTDGLATALKDSASALKTAQNDFYEASALAVSANTVVQDPSKVGAGLRTISLRLTGTEAARKELEELGEDVSDFQVTTTSKLNQQIMDLTRTQDSLSVSLLDMNGNYRSTYEILLDIAKVWDKIAEEDLITGENRQNALLEMMAGKNRSNILASILESPDVLESAYNSAINATGSAQEELDKFLESIDGRMAKLSNQAQEFWYKLIDSDTIKNGITLLTELLGLATDFVDTFGALGTLGAGAGLFAGIKNVGKRRSNYVS